eukprot:GHVQ01017198.1.p1 GENE.GHVQ01017198.1~~GHVQ01017198.1.p1  ORF type:complete len:159 (-),score=24.14 GHVQ01017198.1:490-966(-)
MSSGISRRLCANPLLSLKDMYSVWTCGDGVLHKTLSKLREEADASREGCGSLTLSEWCDVELHKADMRPSYATAVALLCDVVAERRLPTNRRLPRLILSTVLLSGVFFTTQRYFDFVLVRTFMENSESKIHKTVQRLYSTHAPLHTSTVVELAKNRQG